MPESIFNLRIFQGIERSVVENIILMCEERDFSAGEIILAEGVESNGEGYILRSGTVSISIAGNHIADLGEGDMFGEIALLNEEQRTATVKARSDIRVIVLSLDNLIDMINNDENIINKEIMRRMEENLTNS